MLTRSIAVATAPFQLPLRQALIAAAQTGATGIQLNARTELDTRDFGETARRQLLHSLSEHGLKLASLSFPLRHALIEEQYLDARLQGLQAAMTLARELKTSLVTASLGGIPALADSRQSDLLLQVLNDLARHGNHVGVTLCLSLRDEDASHLSRNLQQVTAGPVGIDFDPSSIAISRQPLGPTVRTLHPYLRTVQIRDAVRDQGGFGREVPVGRGEVDWDEFAAVLYEVEFAGWLTVIRNDGDDRQGDTTRAVQYLRNLLPA